MRDIVSKGSFKNIRVYGIEESVIASGYPMRTEVDLMSSEELTYAIRDSIKRIKSLGNAKPGSGHDSFLKGVSVHFDWVTPVLIQPQLGRYHFIDVISSQSAMHRITKIKIDEKAFRKHTHPEAIKLIRVLIEEYNDDYTYKDDFPVVMGIRYFSKDELWNAIISTCPQGLLKTARYTTNFLQLKTMYNQRDNHKLFEWKEFQEFCERLPYFKEFCLGG